MLSVPSMSSRRAAEPASRKRKQRAGEEECPPPRQSADGAEPCAPVPAQSFREGGGGNRLLAGFLANEFLTRAAAKGSVESSSSYAGVARLLMCADGPRVPGVVNPTQLIDWLRK